MLGQETSMVSNEKQSNIFTETFNKLFKENKESSMFDRFSSLDAKEKMLAVTAVGVIFGALLPVVAVALPVAATGAAVALTLFFAVKAVEYGYKGLKWSAEKTWEGAKRVGEQIKKVAVRAKDSINRKTSDTALSLSAKLANAASKTNYSDELSNMTPEQKQQSQELRRMLKNLKDNPELTESVFSKMLSIVKSEKQKGFLSDLDSSGLHRVLATTSTPKEQFLLNKILFENYGEIKEVIQKLKKEYKFDQSVKRNNAQDEEERKANKPSSKKPISSLFSLGGKRGSMQSNSSSMSFASTNSTDGSPVPKEVVPQVTPSGRSSPTQGKKPDYVIIGIEGNDRGLTDFGYYSDSSSGRGSPLSSGSSTPTGVTPESLTQALAGLKKTGSPYKSEQPSTHMSEQKHTPVNRRLETLV